MPVRSVRRSTRSHRRARTGPPVAARLLATAALVAGLGACGGMGGYPSTTYARVVVENDSPETVNIFAIRGGTRIRMGTVAGLRTDTFDLRSSMVGPGGELALLIDPIGSSRQYPTRRIYISEGDVVTLQVSAFIR